jgi:hypothetical protein
MLRTDDFTFIRYDQSRKIGKPNGLLTTINDIFTGNEPLTCCDTDQLITLERNMRLPQQFLEHCSSCYYNFHNLFCYQTCYKSKGDSRNVPDEGDSRNVPDEGDYRNVPDEGGSRNVPDEGDYRNVPDEGDSRNVL